MGMFNGPVPRKMEIGVSNPRITYGVPPVTPHLFPVGSPGERSRRHAAKPWSLPQPKKGGYNPLRGVVRVADTLASPEGS